MLVHPTGESQCGEDVYHKSNDPYVTIKTEGSITVPTGCTNNAYFSVYLWDTKIHTTPVDISGTGSHILLGDNYPEGTKFQLCSYGLQCTDPNVNHFSANVQVCGVQQSYF